MEIRGATTINFLNKIQFTQKHSRVSIWYFSDGHDIVYKTRYFLTVD